MPKTVKRHKKKGGKGSTRSYKSSEHEVNEENHVDLSNIKGKLFQTDNNHCFAEKPFCLSRIQGDNKMIKTITS